MIMLGDTISAKGFYPSAAASFPSEILVEIFSYLSFENHLTRPRRLPALTLGLVCRRWRDFILDSPRFWSSISFNCRVDDLFLPLLRIHLERSQGIPLSVNTGKRKMLVIEGPILDAVVPHSERWTRINFSISLPLISNLSPIKGHLDSLQELDLLVYARWQIPCLGIDLFESAPALRTLVLASLTSRDVRIPWAQITDLTSKFTTLRDALETASLCTSLERLSISHWERGRTHFTVTYPTLRHLRLTADDVDDEFRLVDAFESLVVPAVRSLEVVVDSDDGMTLWPSVPFQLMMMRSGGSLQTLVLRRVRMTAGDLILSLQSVPELQTLDIDELLGFDPVLTDNVIRLLTRIDSPHHLSMSVLVPGLRHLRLQGLLDIDDSLLVTMVESRLPTESDRKEPSQDELPYLLSVHLDYRTRDMRAVAKHGLQALGLHVTINDTLPAESKFGTTASCVSAQPDPDHPPLSVSLACEPRTIFSYLSVMLVSVCILALAVLPR